MLVCLGSGSGNKTCPCLYHDTDTDTLIVQGTITADPNTVLVPHALLDWATEGMSITVGATGRPGLVSVTGKPATPQTLSELSLAEDETAVEVPLCV